MNTYVMKTKNVIEDFFEYCKKKNIVGFGWNVGFDELQEVNENEYLETARLFEPWKEKGIGKLSSNIKKINKMEPGDLIWLRNNGIHYLCRVKSKWKYGNEDDRNHDIQNKVYVDKFVEVGSIDKVPGHITRKLNHNSAVVQDVNENINLFSQYIYNLKVPNTYSISNELNKNLWDFFNEDEVEELVSLYLQFNYNYLVLTSTNKKNTEKIEFALINKDDFHLASLQVKSGIQLLNSLDYMELLNIKNKNKFDKIYLFSPTGYIGDDISGIIKISEKEILEFIEKNLNILSYSTQEKIRFIRSFS